MYTIVINCHLAIFWKFNSVPDVSNLLKLPTPILLEVSLSTKGTVFVGFHLRFRQHIIYFHWSSPFQNYLSIFPFLFLKFRIPTIRTLIILFFLPLLSSTLPKSELRAAITTISTSDHSKVTPSKNEEKSPTAALSVTYTSLTIWTVQLFVISKITTLKLHFAKCTSKFGSSAQTRENRILF